LLDLVQSATNLQTIVLLNNITAFYEEVSNVNERSIDASKYRMMLSVSRLPDKEKERRKSQKSLKIPKW